MSFLSQRELEIRAGDRDAQSNLPVGLARYGTGNQILDGAVLLVAAARIADTRSTTVWRSFAGAFELGE
jgi:hypothetical protein